MILEELNHGKLGVARGGKGKISWISEHNEINFSNATIVATYKVFLFEERQKKAFDYRDKNFKLWFYLYGTTFIDLAPTHLVINFACSWRKKHILKIAKNGDAFLFNVSCMSRLGFVASVVMFFFLFWYEKIHGMMHCCFFWNIMKDFMELTMSWLNLDLFINPWNV
jgi:hypothetical protein